MDVIRVRYLLQQQAADQLTLQEVGELEQLLAAGNPEELTLMISDLIELESVARISTNPKITRETFNKIIGIDKARTAISAESVKAVHRVHFIRRWGWAAAVFVLAAGVYLWVESRSRPERVAGGNTQHLSADVVPGKNGAILTLADGKQIVLDSLSAGVIATQNGTNLVLKNDQLAYDAGGKSSGEVTYNTMSTPKGRQFHVRLPDGTEVWLNAASSIRYPTSFKGKERTVEVTGEAYFEVAANPKMPFKVAVDHRAEIEVLGTHFNVNGYVNEASLNTTLLEGSILVNRGMEKVLLKPGQEALITQDIKVVRDADIDKIMAWKNGYFNFEGMSLREVMQQLERWYDIDVVYENNAPDVRFYGELSRDLNLSGIIAALKDSDVHFRIEGKKLIVLP